jgi:hypothetical protein
MGGAMPPRRSPVRRSLLVSFASLVALAVPVAAQGCAGKVAFYDGSVAPGCTATTIATCPTAAQAYSCVAGSFPYGTQGVTLECSSPVLTTSGDSNYCCTPSTAPQTSACTWNSASSSSCPGLPFRCKPGDDPATLDSQLTCNAGSADPDGTSTDFCCSYPGDAATGG